MKLTESPAILASGVSTIILTSDPDELCERSEKSLEEEQAGNISYIYFEENGGIVDKLLEYKCIIRKQHKQNPSKCYLLRTRKK